MRSDVRRTVDHGRRTTPDISRREADVLAALGDRLTNAEIASRLYISVRTVESHVSALLRKFDVGAGATWRRWHDGGRSPRLLEGRCPRR